VVARDEALPAVTVEYGTPPAAVPATPAGGDLREAAIPDPCGGAAGGVALRITLADPSGNVLRQTFDPAFVCVPVACGDGALDAEERCDDGNAADGDGCSAACVACAGGTCPAPTWRTLPDSARAFGAFDERVSWDQADGQCRGRGGHLATLSTEAEHAFVAGWAQGPLWIGATDQRREGDMVWVTGEPVGFARFALGEPDDRNGESDCVAIDRDGRWHDRPCRDRYGYLCEID
jgi:cysteine-rich repeat protein